MFRFSSPSLHSRFPLFLGFFVGFAFSIIVIFSILYVGHPQGIYYFRSHNVHDKHFEESRNLVFKKGYTWSPFRVTFYVGDTVWFMGRVDVQRVNPSTAPQYRLQVKQGVKEPWNLVGQFSEKMPGFLFPEEGLYTFLLDEKIGKKIQSIWMGQFFVSPRQYLQNRCNILRTTVSHHFMAQEDTNEAWPYRQIAQECLIGLLLMYCQHKELTRDEFIKLLQNFSSTGFRFPNKYSENNEGNDSPIFITTPELGEIEINLTQCRLRWNRYYDSYRLSMYPGVDMVFQKTDKEPPRVAIAAAVTYLIHCHFVFSQLPWQTIMLGYPEITYQLGHCGTYQYSLLHLLKEMGYITRRVGVTYNGGSRHFFNEILCERGSTDRIYTLDATASVYFRGSVTDLTKAELPIYLPKVSILADILWDPGAETSIKAENIKETILGDWERIS